MVPELIYREYLKNVERYGIKWEMVDDWITLDYHVVTTYGIHSVILLEYVSHEKINYTLDKRNDIIGSIARLDYGIINRNGMVINHKEPLWHLKVMLYVKDSVDDIGMIDLRKRIKTNGIMTRMDRYVSAIGSEKKEMCKRISESYFNHANGEMQYVVDNPVKAVSKEI